MSAAILRTIRSSHWDLSTNGGGFERADIAEANLLRLKEKAL